MSSALHFAWPKDLPGDCRTCLRRTLPTCALKEGILRDSTAADHYVFLPL